MSLITHKKLYSAVVQEKWDRVSQELRGRVDIEGDRRRFSMIVIKVLDWEHYIAALADFILTINETMVEDLRPPQPNRTDRPRGRFIKFEDGILCQVRLQYSILMLGKALSTSRL